MRARRASGQGEHGEAVTLMEQAVALRIAFFGADSVEVRRGLIRDILSILYGLSLQLHTNMCVFLCVHPDGFRL